MGQRGCSDACRPIPRVNNLRTFVEQTLVEKSRSYIPFVVRLLHRLVVLITASLSQLIRLMREKLMVMSCLTRNSLAP